LSTSARNDGHLESDPQPRAHPPAHRELIDHRNLRGVRDLQRGSNDPIAFIHAIPGLHARIASVGPNVILRSVCTSLLEVIESPARAERAALDRSCGQNTLGL
jgi:hypothetical protein